MAAREDPELQLIDVREPYEREAGHIAGTRHIELVELTAQAATHRARAAGRLLLPRGRALGDGRPGVPRRGLRGLLDARRPACAGRDEGRPLSPEGGHVADH